MARELERGFTLVEVLIAMSVLAVGLLAVLTGMGTGLDAIEIGRQQSTAVFFAEERIEAAKALAMQKSNLVNVTAANLPTSEGYGSLFLPCGAGSCPAAYRRTTTITANPAGAAGKRIDVAVYWHPVTSSGVLTTERSVSLSLFLSNVR